MWGGVPKSKLARPEYLDIFRHHKAGKLHNLRTALIQQQSPSTAPRPWAIFRGLDTMNHRLRNQDCALLLKWTKDMYLHYTHREDRMQAMQLGVEMFDVMLKKHLVGVATLQQFLALCECSGDLQTAMSRFNFILERLASTAAAGGSSTNQGDDKNAAFDPSHTSDFHMALGTSPSNYVWLMRIALASSSNGGLDFDSVPLEESMRSIAEIVIPRAQMEKIMNNDNKDNSSSLSNSSSTSNNSAVIYQKRSRMRRFATSKQNQTSSSGTVDESLIGLVAPHDTTEIYTSALTISKENKLPLSSTTNSSSSSSPSDHHHQNIPFSIAVMFHLLRPHFRTDEKLQKIVDQLITPSLLAQDAHEMRTLTSIPVSPNHLHLRYLKSALMTDLVNFSELRANSGNNNNFDVEKHRQVSKFLLRKIALSLRNFNYSSAELSDGPRGAAGMLWVGGADNWDNAQPGFDFSEILSEEFSPSPSSSLLASFQSADHGSDRRRAASVSSSSSSIVSVEKHYAVSSFATIASGGASIPSQLPYQFQWTFNNPYPLANSILSEGHIQDIVETLSSLISNNRNNNETKSLLVHKLALLVNSMPKHLHRRFEMDSLLTHGVPYFRADSREMLKGGSYTEYHQTESGLIQEKASTQLIFQTLTTSNSTPELLHYLLCAVGRIAPGKAIEALCKMLVAESNNDSSTSSLLLLPLDPTLATLICCLLKNNNNNNSSKEDQNHQSTTPILMNKETIRLAASLMAHSSLVRRRRLDSYRDARINDDPSPVLRSVWFKRYFDHVFETNCMSEVQFLTFVGREVGPEVLVELFRVSTQMVEDIIEEMGADQAELVVRKMEARREIEAEKKEIEDATAASGGAVASMQLLEKLQKLTAATGDLDEMFAFDEAKYFSEGSPIVRAFEEIKMGKVKKNTEQQEEEDKNNISNEDDENDIRVGAASTDTLILNYPALRQSLQLCLMRSCCLKTSSSSSSENSSLVVDFDLIHQKNQALMFAPTHSPLFDLACIGNMTGFSRYQPTRTSSSSSWSNLSHVIETMQNDWLANNNNNDDENNETRKKIVLLDSSFIEFSEKFLSLKSEDSSIAAVLVPHCVVSSIDATATCPELAPVDVQSLSVEQEVKRNSNIRMSQLASAASSGTIDVVQFTEQLLAAALTRKNKDHHHKKSSFFVDEKLEELILQRRQKEETINDDVDEDKKSQLAHLKMIESQMKDLSESPFRFIGDVNAIIIDIAKLLSLAAAQLGSKIPPKIVIATNDITLIDRIESELNNNNNKSSQNISYGVGIMTSVPINVLRNPDSIEKMEQESERDSILGVLNESLISTSGDNGKNFVDVSKIDQELIERRQEAAFAIASDDPYSPENRYKEENTIIDSINNSNDEKKSVGLWQQIVDDDDDDEKSQVQINNENDSSSSSESTFPDNWRAKNSREERFPPFARPGGVSFSQEFHGRLRHSELPLQGALEGELDGTNDSGDDTKNRWNFSKTCPVGQLIGIQEIKKRINQLTPFRPGFVFQDEAYRNRPATYGENETSAFMMSRPLRATVPPDMRYRKFQANINDPRNAELVNTYHRELKETMEKRKKR